MLTSLGTQGEAVRRLGSRAQRYRAFRRRHNSARSFLNVGSVAMGRRPRRCPARPLSDGVRPLERCMSAFPRFRQLHPQQQTWRPGGLEGST